MATELPTVNLHQGRDVTVTQAPWLLIGSGDYDHHFAQTTVQRHSFDDDHRIHTPQMSSLPSLTDVIPSYNNPPTKHDWEIIRPLFTKLYFTEARPLKEVMAELKNKHGFNGSIKMYKTYITRWRLRRSINLHEVVQILGIEASRKAKGKKTMFKLRDQLVDMENVHRYQRRKGLRTSDALKMFEQKRHELHSDLEVFSPTATTPIAIQTATERNFERCLFEFRAAISGLVDCGFVILCPYGLTMKHEMIYGWHMELYDLEARLRAESDDTDVHMLFLKLRRFSLILERTIEDCNPWVMLTVLDSIALLKRNHVSAAKNLINHIRSLVKGRTAPSQPNTRIWEALIELDENTAPQSVFKLYELILDIELELRSPMVTTTDEVFTLDTRTVLISLSSEFGFYIDTVQILRFVSNVIHDLGISMDRQLRLMTIVTDGWPELAAESEIADYLQWLADPMNLVTTERGLSLGGSDLTIDSVILLSNIYNITGKLDRQRNLLQHLLHCGQIYKFTADEKWHILDNLDLLSTVSDIADGNMCWRDMKNVIEDHWVAEIESAIPDEDLLDACQQWDGR